MYYKTFNGMMKHIRKISSYDRIPARDVSIYVPSTEMSSSMIVDIVDNNTIDYLSMLYDNRKFKLVDKIEEVGFRNKHVYTYIIKEVF